MDKMGWQVLGRLSWLRNGRQGRGEEEQVGPFFAEVDGPSDGERQEGRVPPLPWLRPAGLLLRLPAAQSRTSTCGGEVWVGSEQRGDSVVNENEMEQEGSYDKHNTAGNDESSETMNDLYNQENDCNIGKIKYKVRENRIQTKVKNDLEPRSDSSVKQELDKEILASKPH
jgi:hypothetical protein